MRFKTWVAGLVLGVACMAALPAMDVRAEELTKENFDYAWYLEQHPDLAAIVRADDYAMIWAFYKNVGAPAGWQGRRSEKSFYTKQNFDYDTFFAMNPDVYAAFKGDKDLSYKWFMDMGYSAGRMAKTTDEAVDARMQIFDIAESITKEGMSVRDKVKAVHDWLCIHVAYDYDNYLNGTIPGSSYSIAGPIKYGKSVCDGYARTFRAFMDTLGIPCKRVVGTADNGLSIGGHAWNKVEIDGIWYWIDVTWDDPVPDRPGIVSWYEYFLISEEKMNRDHFPEGED